MTQRQQLVDRLASAQTWDEACRSSAALDEADPRGEIHYSMQPERGGVTITFGREAEETGVRSAPRSGNRGVPLRPLQDWPRDPKTYNPLPDRCFSG